MAKKSKMFGGSVTEPEPKAEKVEVVAVKAKVTIEELAGCLRKLANASDSSNSHRKYVQRESARAEAFALLERL